MGNIDQINEIPTYFTNYGITSFKFWTGHSPDRGPSALTPAKIWALFKKCKEVGVLPYVNTFNSDIQEQIVMESEEQASRNSCLKSLAFFKRSRPTIIETLWLNTTLHLA